MLKQLIVWGVLMLTQTAGTASTELSHLEHLKWQHRIIIIHTQAGEQYERVIRQFQEYQFEIDDRDIVWFIHSGERIISNTTLPVSVELSEQLSLYDLRQQVDEFSAVLIGKDGGVKQRQRQWDIDSIMALIDTMPMRRWEMKYH